AMEGYCIARVDSRVYGPQRSLVGCPYQVLRRRLPPPRRFVAAVAKQVANGGADRVVRNQRSGGIEREQPRDARARADIAKRYTELGAECSCLEQRMRFDRD